MITIDTIKLHIRQYLEMVIKTSDIVDLEDLITLIPTMGRK
jgi:hypothetical protein